MRVLWLTAVMMLGSVSCLVAENKSGVKVKYGDTGTDGNKENFLSDWCSIVSDSWDYGKDGRLPDDPHPKEIHISNHRDRMITEQQVKGFVAGETVEESGERLLKIDGHVHTWQHKSKNNEVRMNDLAIQWFKKHKKSKGHGFSCFGLINNFPKVSFDDADDGSRSFSMPSDEKSEIWQYIGHPDGRLALVMMDRSDGRSCPGGWTCTEGAMYVFGKDGHPVYELKKDNGWPKLLWLDLRIQSPSYAKGKH